MLVAERTLKIVGPSEPIEVPIAVFLPREVGESWVCRFTIGWPDGEIAMDAGGVDGIQALLLALKMIGAIVYSSDHYASGELIWLEQGKGYGFPITNGLRDMLIGEDKNFF